MQFRGLCDENDSVRVCRSIRKRSLAETSQFQEPFEVYIQALVSQCLDANFMQEVFNDKGEKEEEAAASLVSEVVYTQTPLYPCRRLLRVQHREGGLCDPAEEGQDHDRDLLVRQVPEGRGHVAMPQRSRSLRCTGERDDCQSALEANSSTKFFFFSQDLRCGACDKDKAGTMFQMFGQPYDTTSLKTVPPSQDASLNRVSLARLCNWNTTLIPVNFFAEPLRVFQVLAPVPAVPPAPPPETPHVRPVSGGRREQEEQQGRRRHHQDPQRDARQRSLAGTGKERSNNSSGTILTKCSSLLSSTAIPQDAGSVGRRRHLRSLRRNSWNYMNSEHNDGTSTFRDHNCWPASLLESMHSETHKHAGLHVRISE